MVLLAGLLSAFAALVALEISLRAVATWLPMNIANTLLGRYNDWAPGGIFFYDETPGLSFMRPNHETTTFCSGYFWRHQTDEWGFRNRPGVAKEILLLGDSMIYGHGVDLEHTAAEILRTEYGHPVYNMSRTADCLYQHYMLLRMFAERWKPKQAVLFVLVNDPQDVYVYRPGPALLTRPELTHYDYKGPFERMQARGKDPPRQFYQWSMLSFTRRLYVGWQQGWGVPTAELFPQAEDQSRRITPYWVFAVEQPGIFGPVTGYFRAVVTHLARFLGDRGVELRMVWLDTRDAAPGLDRVHDMVGAMVAQICEENGLVCDSTLSEFSNCQDCYLAGDGHYTPKGNRRLAR
ncbi:MAG: hypothetical protein MJD61_00875 [Proteobacteria bacterium]|nr:hypothetical protein [Pseudomonadota bacterium]